jgi:hypothetical protein
MTAAWAFEEPHALALLEQAAECLDRIGAARNVLAREGAIIHDRFGSPKEHPAARAERAAMALFAAIVRDLRLEDDEQ